MKKKYLVALVLLMVIGFASIATQLFINGTIKIGADKEQFNEDVYFSAVTPDDDEVDWDEKNISYTPATLKNLEDEANLEFTIKNDSSNYDAALKLECTINKDEYVDISVVLDGSAQEDGTYLVSAGGSITGSINAKLVKSFAGGETVTTGDETQDYEISCTIDANAKEKQLPQTDDDDDEDEDQDLLDN